MAQPRRAVGVTRQNHHRCGPYPERAGLAYLGEYRLRPIELVLSPIELVLSPIELVLRRR
jgi:hypothetical protein